MLARLIKDERGAFTNTYVSQAIQFIEDHYDQDISLESLAGQIGISPFYLSRLFKSEIGQTFVEYLTQLRVQEAIKLASNTRLSIKEIAGRTGYQNPTYLEKVFKKLYRANDWEFRGRVLRLDANQMKNRPSAECWRLSKDKDDFTVICTEKRIFLVMLKACE